MVWAVGVQGPGARRLCPGAADKEVVMTAENRDTRFVQARLQPPPLTSGPPLHWDGLHGATGGAALTPGAALEARAAVPVQGARAGAGCAPLPLPRWPWDPCIGSTVPAIDWAIEAARMTFYLAPRILLAP